MLLPANSVEYRHFSALVCGVVALLICVILAGVVGHGVWRQWHLSDAVMVPGRVLAINETRTRGVRAMLELEYQYAGDTYRTKEVPLPTSSKYSYNHIKQAHLSGVPIDCHVASSHPKLVELDRPGLASIVPTLLLAGLMSVFGFVAYRFLSGYFRINAQIRRSRVRKS